MNQRSALHRAPHHLRGLLLVLAVLAVLLVLLASILAPGRAGAQAAPSIVETTIDRGNFPLNLTFAALIDNGENLESAVLFYQVPPEGAITRRQADVTSGDITRVEAVATTNNGTIYIPPGATIEWWWGLTSTDGETVETERQVFRYEDPRYEWQVIADDSLELYYYENQNIAEALHVVGRETLQRIGPLLGVEIDFPAKIYLWSNTQDASGIERVESDTFEQLIFTGGTRVLADLVHVFSPQPWIVAHELTHILTKAAGEGIADLPAWLDEGTATYAEVDWRARRGLALQQALDQDRILSVRSIGSSTNAPGDVDLFYGQSGDIVTALVDEFGEEQFTELFAVFKRGTTVDNALMEVYGFDREGLDAFYREQRGLEAREATEDRSTQIEDDQVGPAGGDAQAQADPDEQDASAQAQPAPDSAGDESDAGTPESDGRADDEETAQAQAADEQSGESGRDETQVSARRDSVEAWNSTLRLGPSFGPGDGFPWEAVVTGLGGAALLLSLVSLFVVLGRPGRSATEAHAFDPTRWQPPPPAPTPAAPPAERRSAPDTAPWGGWRDRGDAEASTAVDDATDPAND